MKNALKNLRDWLFPEVSPEVTREVDALNVLVINVMAIFYAATLLVAIILELTGIVKPENEQVALFSLVTGFIFCIVIHVVFAYIRRHCVENHTLIKIIDVVFSVVILLWVISISARMYNLGNQIVSFYCIVFSLVCFTVIHPATSIPLFSSAFICLYIIAYAIDGAAEISPFNFMSFMLISIAGSVEKYRVTIDKINKNLKSEALNASYLHMMRHDPLTKAQNRNAFVEDSPNYYGKCLDLCVCDVDNFKQLNDTYGHLAGDKVLSSLAAILIDRFGGESVYRFGGDEFIIIKEAGENSDFSKDWEDIQPLVYDIKIDDINAYVGCSGGISRGTPENGKDFQDLMTSADKELYKIKKQKKSASA